MRYPSVYRTSQVKDLYGLDEEVTFRNVSVPSENRPHPLTLGTATQIGLSICINDFTLG